MAKAIIEFSICLHCVKNGYSRHKKAQFCSKKPNFRQKISSIQTMICSKFAALCRIRELISPDMGHFSKSHTFQGSSLVTMPDPWERRVPSCLLLLDRIGHNGAFQAPSPLLERCIQSTGMGCFSNPWREVIGNRQSENSIRYRQSMYHQFRYKNSGHAVRSIRFPASWCFG